MALKAKHAHGSRKNLESAIANNLVDSFDVLFLSGEDENPAMGWLDKNGKTIILSPADEVAKLETQVDEKIASKADAADVETLATEVASKASAEEVQDIKTQVESKADAEKVESLETELATKVTAEEVDKKVEAAIEKPKYEIADVPEGTLVNIDEHEIRIMCPVDAEYHLQGVGVGGDPNTYYVTLKTYVYDDNVVGYKEHLGNAVDPEILTDLKTDKYGRRFQPTWLGVAKYDEATGVWNYYGKNSTVSKYIGWDYQIDFYDANGVMIASDSIRINLSNEDCHSEIKPYYMGTISKDIEEKIEQRITEINTGYEIVEF